MRLPPLNPHSLLRASTALLLLAWLAWLGEDSWQLLQSLETQANIAPPLATALPRDTADPVAIAQLFGVLPQETDESIPEVPLTLLASLLESQPEQSRALIAAPDGSRFYRIGETLPGGGILRQISSSHVLIQRQGAEQVLPMNTTTAELLIPLADPAAAPAITPTRAASERFVKPSF